MSGCQGHCVMPTSLQITLRPSAMWFHNVISLDFGVAVNVFWRHLEENFYDHKDTYGNKDLVPATRAMQVSSLVLRVGSHLNISKSDIGNKYKVLIFTKDDRTFYL